MVTELDIGETVDPASLVTFAVDMMTLRIRLLLSGINAYTPSGAEVRAAVDGIVPMKGMEN